MFHKTKVQKVILRSEPQFGDVHQTDVHIVGKKMARNGPKTATLFSVSFRISLY